VHEKSADELDRVERRGPLATSLGVPSRKSASRNVDLPLLFRPTMMLIGGSPSTSSRPIPLKFSMTMLEYTAITLPIEVFQ